MLTKYLKDYSEKEGSVKEMDVLINTRILNVRRTTDPLSRPRIETHPQADGSTCRVEPYTNPLRLDLPDRNIPPPPPPKSARAQLSPYTATRVPVRRRHER